MQQQEQPRPDAGETAKERSESGPANSEAMEQAQEDAAEEREENGGYQ